MEPIEIQDLKDQVDIADYISECVDLVEEKNGNLFGLCPFHDEQTPSFSVNADKKIWYCFGCGKGGDIFDFIQQHDHKTFAQTVEILKKKTGCLEDRYSFSKVNKRTVVKRVSQKYTMKEIPTRSIKPLSKDIMNMYPASEDDLQPWITEGILLEKLIKYEVGFDKISKRIMYPIKDIDGNIINISGRTVLPDWKEKKIRKYTYTESIGSNPVIYGLYENLKAIEKTKEIIIFEGAKSVMKADGFGYENSGALLTSHLNYEQLKILIGLRVRIVFALDSDVNILNDKNIQKLKKYTEVFEVRNIDKVLEEKMSPVDKGKEIWEFLYQNMTKYN